VKWPSILFKVCIKKMNNPSQQHSHQSSIGIGLIGCGTVGQGVVQLLASRADCHVVTIAVRDTQRERPGVPSSISQVVDPFEVINHPDVAVVVEVAGSVQPARSWITAALKAGKSVVTANKDLIALHGEELRELAQLHGAALLYEAAVAAGIPVLLPLKQSLAANRVERLAGILNGTCNYILTRMAEDGWSYTKALSVAQEKGFAEADPTNDVGGKDTAYKLAILTRLAFGQPLAMDKLHCEGIDNLSDTDLALAKTLGYTVKLLGMAQKTEDGKLDCRVHPVMLPVAHPLAAVANEFNALWIEGDAVGELMFVGRGAGSLPTASGVCGDVLSLIKGLSQFESDNDGSHAPALLADPRKTESPAELCKIDTSVNRYYIRLQTLNNVGVIGAIGQACGDASVSLESIVQHGISEEGTATIVLVTHAQREADVNAALDAMVAHSGIEQVAAKLRILD
jgi:homoserine dehydrogenase